MNLILDFIQGLLVTTMILCVILLVRNQWVYKQRGKFLDDHGWREYNQLLSYNDMMFKWWVWDINKLRKSNL